MSIFSTLRPIEGSGQKITTGAASAQATNAVGAHTTEVRLVAVGNPCFVSFGPNPTAVADTTSIYLPVGVPEYFHVNGGDKIAAIQSGAAGTLYITEMTR